MATTTNSDYFSWLFQQAKKKISSQKQIAINSFKRKKDIDIGAWKRTIRATAIRERITWSGFDYQRLLKLLIHYHVCELILNKNPSKMVLNAVMAISMMYSESGIKDKVFTNQVNDAYVSLKSHFLFGM